MDFADLPTVYIEHDSETHCMTTAQTEDEFVLSLRHNFGKDCPPAGKTVIVVGENDGLAKGKENLRAPLSLLLAKQVNSSSVLKLEFADVAPPTELVAAKLQKGTSLSVGRQLQQSGSMQLQETDARYFKLKKGTVQSKKRDAEGNIITSLGPNSEKLLTNLEKVEVQRYVLYHWEGDEKTGIPFKQTDQKSIKVEESLLDMKTNAVLKDRPVAALRRYAQK
jgi:hypothetical protein